VTISQTALDVRARARQGLVGMLAAFGPLVGFATLINSDPQAVQSDTVTFSGFTGPTKTITINGIDIVYTAETSTTVTAANLAAAINAEPGVRGQVLATSAGAVATLVGLTPGLAYTVSDSDGETAIASVATAAAAAVIPFGRLVIDDGANADSGPTRLGKLAATTGFVAQTATLTVVFEAAVEYMVTVRNAATGAILASVQVLADTNSNTTAAALEAALAAALPANTVNETVNTNVVTLVSEVLGLEFEVQASAIGATTGSITLANTVAASASTSVHRAAVGVSMHSNADEAATIGADEASYPANHGFRALTRGLLYVDRPGAVAKGDRVFVELAAGSNAGKFFTSGSSTRVELSPDRFVWERDGRTSTDGLAALRVTLAA